MDFHHGKFDSQSFCMILCELQPFLCLLQISWITFQYALLDFHQRIAKLCENRTTIWNITNPVFHLLEFDHNHQRKSLQEPTQLESNYSLITELHGICATTVHCKRERNTSPLHVICFPLLSASITEF